MFFQGKHLGCIIFFRPTFPLPQANWQTLPLLTEELVSLLLSVGNKKAIKPALDLSSWTYHLVRKTTMKQLGMMTNPYNCAKCCKREVELSIMKNLAVGRSEWFLIIFLIVWIRYPFIVYPPVTILPFRPKKSHLRGKTKNIFYLKLLKISKMWKKKLHSLQNK